MTTVSQAFEKYIQDECKLALKELQTIQTVLDRAAGLGVKGHTDATVAVSRLRAILITMGQTPEECTNTLAHGIRSPGEFETISSIFGHKT